MAMEPNGVTSLRNRQSPSSDRFLGMFTLANFPVSAVVDDDELDEAEVFWTAADSSPMDRRQAPRNDFGDLGLRRQKSLGILAALQDDRKSVTPSATSFRVSPAVAKRSQRLMKREFSHSQSLPSRRLQRAAPMNVPRFSKAAMMRKNHALAGFGDRSGDGAEEEEDDDDQILPPHEIVSMKMKSTNSVLEGVGRTLKGRDLRQVRNAVWRQTGFLG